MFQPGSMSYTQGFGSSANAVAFPAINKRSPSSSDVNYPLGKPWVNQLTGQCYMLGSFSSVGAHLSANWAFLGSTGGDLNTLTTDDLTVVSPTAGNINLAGMAPLATTGSGSTATVALTGIVDVANGGTGSASLTDHGVLVGSGITAVTALAVGATGTLLSGATGADPAFTGSPSVTGSITAGTNITSTLGNITATNGNLVLSTVGNKLSINASSSATCSAGTFVLGGGATTVVSNSAVTASSLIFVTSQALGTVTVPSSLAVTAKSAGVSFTVTPSDASDTSTVSFLIVN